MAKPTGIPTPTPTPTATWSLPGCALGEGVTTVSADGGESSDGVDGLEDGVEDGVGDGARDDVGDGGPGELVERRTLITGAVLVRADPRVLCIVAGSESKENSRDGVAQHLASVKP